MSRLDGVSATVWRCLMGGLLWWAAAAVWAQAAAVATPVPAVPVPAASAPAASSSAPSATPSAAASASAPNARVRLPPLVWRLEIQAPVGLADLLRNYLDIARFQAEAQRSAPAADDPVPPPQPLAASAPASAASEAPPAQRTRSLDDTVISRSELRRLVAAAPDQARALLEAEGYFNADVRMTVQDKTPNQDVVITMLVDPGPKATIKQVQMVYEGELDTSLSSEDPAALSLAKKIEREWALPKGEAFRQTRWSSAKSAMLASMRSEGYATAAWSGTSATVDAQSNEVRLYLVADSGPAFRYGEITIEGLKRQPESALRNLMPFKTGDPYRERQLLDFQERVQKLNLFESVFVNLADDPTQAAAAPINVQVRELALQQATFGVGVSSDTGPRVSVEHVHRLLWGYPVQAKSKVQLGRDESLLQSDLTSHPLPGGKRWLGAFQFARQLGDDDAVTLSGRVRAGLSDEGDRLERTTYLEYQRARVNADDGLKISEASALTGMQQWVWRDLDSTVLPTRGVTANVSVGAGRSFSTLTTGGWFGRALGRLTWYRPLPWQWYATVRGEAGQVLAADEVGVPDTLLFKAGGDDSVRGYGYRTLGVESEGVTLGGRSLVTGSVEVAHPLLARFPTLWGALFVDAGDAAAKFSALRPRLGYGTGVRWRSPVGPLRLDLAYGHEIKSFRLHFSVGIML